MPSYIGYRPQFEPISLQEYLAVPTAVLGEYAKAEDAYNETANKAEALKALLGERNADNEAGWKIVDRYERQLGDLADNISKGIQGPEAYRQARGASRYYRENMLPLESGIPAYQKELEKWNADPTMIGSKPALESYIKNPLYRAQMMSGNTIQAEAMKAAATASDRRKQETKDRLIRGGQNYSYYELTGFNPEEQQAYYLNSDAVPELKQLEDSITNKYVQQGYNDADARRYAKLGIIEGITYDRKRHDAKNEAWKNPSETFSYSDLLEGQGTTDNSDVIYPSTERPASFGRPDLTNKTGNFAVVNNDGSVSAKKGDDLLDAFGIPKSEQRYHFTDSAGQKHYKEHKFTQDERLAKLFDKDGKINLTYIKNSKITGTREKKLHIEQLKDFGFDFNQSFNSPERTFIVTEGRIGRETQRLETVKGNSNRERFKNLENTLQSLYQTSPEGISNSMFTVIPTKYPVSVIRDLISKTNTNDWLQYEGMEKTDEGNLSPKGKKVSKERLITQFNLAAAEESGDAPTMDLIPGSNYALIDLHNDKQQQFVVPLDRIDPDNYQRYTYSHAQLKQMDEDLHEFEAIYNKRVIEYRANPTRENYYKKEMAARDLLNAKYKKEHLGDVYVGGLTKSRVDVTNSRNINTESFGKTLNSIINQVTQ